MVLARAQVFEKLIDDEQQPLVRMYLIEGGHHLLKGSLVVDHLVGRRKAEADALAFEEEFEFLSDDVTQGHLAGDFDAMHFKLARDSLCGFSDLGVADHRDIGSVLSD